MYKTCIYCNRSLGDNDVVEQFPVGSRLAFDSEKGRLWVICGRCRRWNLSPLDERWEAIEECERRFRTTRLRYSTENIGLARLRGGLELVRIGRPLRPEFAAWRYGIHLVRRRIRRIARASAQAVGYTLSTFAGVILFYFTDDNSRIVARVRAGDGQRLHVIRKDLKELELNLLDGAGRWSLTVPHRAVERFRFLGLRGRGERQTVELEGAVAVRAASYILPRINSFGGTARQVREAVTLLEEVGPPERVFAAAPRLVGQTRLTRMGPETRLALEMAAHEETERWAMEGELAVLKAAWREAEEIAYIADRLLIPESVENWIRQHRETGSKKPTE